MNRWRRGADVAGSRAEHRRDPPVRGSRQAADGERIDRAAKSADWAGRALKYAAEDLREADTTDGSLEGLTEVVLEEAGRVSSLAEDIESRKDDWRRDAAR